jgi:predicted TPR repeat methyltransferase
MPPADADADADAAVARARRYFEQFAVEYDEAARASGWSLNGRLAGALAGTDPGGRAVDLACGTGTTLAELRRALPAASLVGVDLADAMVERAATAAPGATVVRADVRSFVDGSAPGSFDVVTAIGGFEFTPGLPRLLDGIRRLVAPGGHLVFTYEPVLAGWPPQEQRVETNLGSNGLELTTYRWEPGEVTAGFDGWEAVRSELLVAYLRDELPTVYGWLHYRRR